MTLWPHSLQGSSTALWSPRATPTEHGLRGCPRTANGENASSADDKEGDGTEERCRWSQALEEALENQVVKEVEMKEDRVIYVALIVLVLLVGGLLKLEVLPTWLLDVVAPIVGR